MDVLALKILNEPHSGTLVLDQERVAIAGIAPLSMECDRFASEVGVFKPFPDDVQHIDGFAADLHHHRDRIAGEFLFAHARYPS